jgi:hypothetical protein
MASPTRGGDPFPLAKQNVQDKVNKLQQDYSRYGSLHTRRLAGYMISHRFITSKLRRICIISALSRRWASMTLSHPSKIGLGEQIQGSLAMLKRTLHTMDKTVDKAEQDPERYHVTIRELHQRWGCLSLTPVIDTICATTL